MPASAPNLVELGTIDTGQGPIATTTTTVAGATTVPGSTPTTVAGAVPGSTPTTATTVAGAATPTTATTVTPTTTG